MEKHSFSSKDSFFLLFKQKWKPIVFQHQKDTNRNIVKELKWQEALTVAKDRISSCKMAKDSTCRLPENENSVELFQGALKDAHR